MKKEILKLNERLDNVIHKLELGVPVERLNETVIIELGKVKEWQSKYGYEFYIYNNDHWIGDNQPHFHLIKKSIDLDCRISFDGKIYEYIGKGIIIKKVQKALSHFLKDHNNQKILKETWNYQNPKYAV